MTSLKKDIIKQIESEAESKGMSISEVLKKAKVHRSSWWRWKQGTNPSLEKLQDILDVVS